MFILLILLTYVHVKFCIFLRWSRVSKLIMWTLNVRKKCLIRSQQLSLVVFLPLSTGPGDGGEGVSFKKGLHLNCNMTVYLNVPVVRKYFEFSDKIIAVLKSCLHSSLSETAWQTQQREHRECARRRKKVHTYSRALTPDRCPVSTTQKDKYLYSLWKCCSNKVTT